ncbi:hypothetical protein QA596_08910 [Balneolales bacterium ANBcel1]|nr:hypothetical protein [Balneolales bacterium ANBcel1]
MATLSRKRTERITLDRENNEHSRRLRKSLNKIRWSHTLMQIFWTAGPVTGLGLIGGYYIGYGQLPSVQLLVYFISFTVLSGLIGLIAKIVLETTRGPLKEQGERDILDVTDKLGDLILAARDMIVQGYEGEMRKREAALQLLRRVDLSPYGVSIAFTDLTGNAEIGEIMGRIYTYRRIGLHSRVREIHTEYHQQVDEIIKGIELESPDAAREIRDWFTGSTFGMSKLGAPREPFFLQRVMSSIENNNPLLMTFRDVEEMIILAFELINGREIPSLVFQYTGRWKFARALDELEIKRSQFRVSQARSGNRIRALSSYLIETGFSSMEELPEGLTINQLVKQVNKEITRLAGELNRSMNNPSVSAEELKRLTGIMKTALELYQMAHKAYVETGKIHTQLIEASGKWDAITSEAYGNPALLRLKSGRRGIQIQENTIHLDDEARLEVCRHLSWYFAKQDTRNISSAFFTSTDSSGALAARRLAIEIALALEPHIRISKPEIQRNINATKATYLGELAPNMNATQKAEIGRRMADVADDRLDVAAEQLAETLVRLYHVDLTKEARDFLHYTYGARPEALELLEAREKATEHPVSYLSERPPAVDPPDPFWIKTQIAAKKALSRRKNH